MSSPTYHERRAHPRERVHIQADLWSQDHNLTVPIVELGEGGMAIANGTLPEKADIHLRFELPFTTAVIRCEARVVWSSVEQDRAGLQFTRLQESERRTLSQWLEHHCAKSAQSD